MAHRYYKLNKFLSKIIFFEIMMPEMVLLTIFLLFAKVMTKLAQVLEQVKFNLSPVKRSILSDILLVLA